MDCSTRKGQLELNVYRVEFEKSSVMGRMNKLTDLRKAKGQRYRLDTLLMIIVLAKLGGNDRPTEMADWPSG